LPKMFVFCGTRMHRLVGSSPIDERGKMADPFTIRIFVPDGDPEGIRLIDRMNWTGLGIVFPRGKWPEVRRRAEMLRTGIYILVGYRDEDDDLPTVYVGQADGVRNRID